MRLAAMFNMASALSISILRWLQSFPYRWVPDDCPCKAEIQVQVIERSSVADALVEGSLTNIAM
jgi:hypothetical protein